MTLAHYTLNTGHARQSPRSEVEDATIRFLDPLIKNGGGYVPGGDHSVSLGFAIAPGKDDRRLIQITLNTAPRGTRPKNSPPLILASLAWGEDAAGDGWRSMLRIATAQGLMIEQEQPADLPILVVLLTAHAALVPPEILTAAADLERCIAWAILAREGLAP